MNYDKTMKKLLQCTKLVLEDSDSEGDEIALELVEIMRKLVKETRKKPKRLWMQPWRKNRKVNGSFAFLTKELLTDSNSYRNILKMDEVQFTKLVELITPEIYRPGTSFRESISVAEKLAITLRFLATGESYKSMNYSSMLSPAFFSKTVPIICDALYRNLRADYLKFPSSPEEWESIAKEFDLHWQFPNCLGALDFKHINFQPPRKDETFYNNYRYANSIVLLALIDAHCKFIFIDVGCNDRNSGAEVLQRSYIKKVLEEEVSLPKDSIVGRGRNLPYVVIADDASPLHKHIMKPYPYHTNCTKEKIFNIRLTRARQVAERPFGMLSNMFEILLKKINLKMETVQKIVLACCVLHNFLIESDSTYSNNMTGISTPRSTDRNNGLYNPQKGSIENIRKEFAEYFNHEGKLDCQEKKLMCNQ